MYDDVIMELRRSQKFPEIRIIEYQKVYKISMPVPVTK